MDRLTNLTHGVNDSTPASGQNCVSTTSSIFDKLLVTTPSWDSINQEARWYFMLHTYGFACLFFILSFYTFFSFLNLRSLISSRPFMSTINIFLCLLGASRSGCLLIDPYNLKGRLPRVIGSIMWDIGFPFITSAFCLIQLALLQLTQLKLGLEKFQKETYLTLVMISYFGFVIVSDVALVFHNHYLAKYIVQSVFLIWGISLYITFLYTGYHIKILLRRLPPNVLIRENSFANQKGIMQLGMLAPYNNLATSVAAALVPTLLGPKIHHSCDDTDAELNKKSENKSSRSSSSKNPSKYKEDEKKIQPLLSSSNDSPVKNKNQISMVPEVFVRPPTPTPSSNNLPTITVSSPSRRSSLASRRGSDVSRNSRRTSDCSIRFAVDEEDSNSPQKDQDNKTQSTKTSDGAQSSPQHSLRRNSDLTSSRELRRGSDLGYEKNRSQFSSKLRRNSDFGNRMPRPPQEEQSKLFKILDHSPSESRRNSDLCGLVNVKPVESRRNSDVSYRSIDRRGSDVSYSKQKFSADTKKSSQKAFQAVDDSDDVALEDFDCKGKYTKSAEGKSRKKNLSWKCDAVKDETEDISAETSLLPESKKIDPRVSSTDFTLHSVLNHIAYVNRTKSDVPLFMPEVNTAAARKSQIERVLNFAYTVAVLGIILSVIDVFRILGPYGLLADAVKYGTKPLSSQYPKPWPWLAYQTLCRALELIMGCAMANITKQPSASPRHQYLNNYSSYNLRMKRGDSLYM